MCDFWWKIGIRDSRHSQSQGSGTGKDSSEGPRGLYGIQLDITAKKIEVKEYEILAAPRDAGCRQVAFVLSRMFFDSPRGLLGCDGVGHLDGDDYIFQRRSGASLPSLHSRPRLRRRRALS